MIHVYNESSTPWDVVLNDDKTENKTISIRRRRDPSETYKMAFPHVRSQRLSILGYSSTFDSITDLTDRFKAAVRTKEIIAVNEQDHDVRFNRKGFRPFISEGRESRSRDVLFGTLDVRGQAITSFHMSGVTILEYYFFNNEFSFIASIDSKRPDGSSFRMTVVNKGDREMTEVAFETQDGKLTLTNTPLGRLTSDAEIVPAKMRRFRPSRPTQIVLVRQDECEVAAKVLDEGRHELVVYDGYTLDGVIAELTANRFGAITLFMNTPYGEKTRESIDRYTGTRHALAGVFRTFHILHNDGRVYRLR